MRVLVTRPQPGADATAQRLGRMGHAPLILPLTRIEPAESLGEAPRHPAGFDAVILTSANALRHGDALPLPAFTHLPLLAVGDASARAARAAGFRHVTAAQGDGASLVELARRTLEPGARLFYPTGRPRTEGFEENLVQAGFAVTTLETYRAVPIAHDDATVIALLAGSPPDAALVHSSHAARLLLALAGRPALRPFFEAARILAISRKVGATFAADGRLSVEVAGRPDEAALLRLLDPPR